MSYSRTATGLITVAAGGTTIALSPDSLREIIQIVKDYAPLIMCFVMAFLLFRVDRDHRKCLGRQEEFHRDIAALKDELQRVKDNCLRCTTRAKLEAQGYSLIPSKQDRNNAPS